MEKFLFTDGEDICLYSDGAVEKFPSKFIQQYKESVKNVERAKRWKHSGEGAQFRGDTVTADEPSFESRISGVHLSEDEKSVIYSFTINQTSGIYKFNFSDEKAPETHIINSIEYQFSGGCLNGEAERLATSLKRNYINSDIAVFNLKTGNYVTVTDGDTLDEDPYFSPENADVIYFSSRGAGRNMNGDFVGFSPAAICRLDLAAMDLQEVKSSDKFSYFKPVTHGGKLYAIKAPAKEKKSNIFLSILLIPFRFLQAIANLITIFIHALTGKSVTSGGSNPAKGREYDSRKVYIRGNLVNVEKEMKKNAGKRDKDYGFVPQSWQLVEVESEKVLASGVGDYDILSDGTIIYTNGRRIFALNGGKKSKLCNAENCLNVSCKHASVSSTDLFNIL